MSDHCEQRFLTSSSSVNQLRGTKNGKKPFERDVCEKRYNRSDHLAVHKRIHTGDKPYECDVCKKKFKESGHLAVHKRTHNGDKPYECDVCKKKFRHSGTLTAHKRTHTGDKPYECDVCRKRYGQSGNLTTHKRTHTGDKPYECDVCKKKFKVSNHLVKHKRTHTGDKPYECDFCKKRFSQSSSRNCHKKGHLLCHTCGTEIIRPQEIQEHIVEDRNTGKYGCNKCNKQSSGFMILFRHIARHHGNDGNYRCGLCQELESKEPTGVGYVCCVCDVVFDVPRDLEDHMVTHDSIE